MAALNFPNSPTEGQIWNPGANLPAFQWSAGKWINLGSALTADPFIFTSSSGGETSIPVTGGYIANMGIVVRGGSAQVPGDDVDISSGSNLLLASALSPGETVVFYKFRAFSLMDALAKSQNLADLPDKMAARNVLNVDGYVFKKVTTFTANGTWIAGAETRLSILQVQGGGGAGGGAQGTGTGTAAAGGGGGGGFIERALLSGWNAAGEAVTVGASVPGGPIGASGIAGNQSSVGTLAVAGGGGGGGGGSKTTSDSRGNSGNVGGDASGTGGVELYSVIRRGEPGEHGIVFGAVGNCITGRGGSSALGTGGASTTEGGSGNAGFNYGGGGSGGGESSTAGRIGGAGAQGLVRIFEFE